MVHYFDIAQVLDDKNKKYWIAWYFESLSNSDPLMKGDNLGT